jgi:hypothetical protein
MRSGRSERCDDPDLPDKCSMSRIQRALVAESARGRLREESNFARNFNADLRVQSLRQKDLSLRKTEIVN